MVPKSIPQALEALRGRSSPGRQIRGILGKNNLISTHNPARSDSAPYFQGSKKCQSRGMVSSWRDRGHGKVAPVDRGTAHKMACQLLALINVPSSARRLVCSVHALARYDSPVAVETRVTFGATP